MYKIIGVDGKEYGPVSLQQLRQWVTEGRINAQTRTQPDGATEWCLLGALPELADLFGTAAGAPPTEPPVTPLANGDALAAELLARDYQINIGHCLSRSWTLIKANFWLLVGASFLGTLIAAGCGIPCIGPIIGLVIGGPMMGGLYALYLKQLRGQPSSLSDAFVGFSTLFVPLMLAHIVSGLLTGLGVLLCVVPGIYLGVAWLFTLPLVTDKHLDFWPAMELSRKVIHQHWWKLFGLVLVAGLVSIAGVLACVVGIFVTIPVAFGAIAYAYEDIFGTQSTPTS